jgi:anti-sigma regulatory factor (Ser/Thr protein kinase)
MTTAETGLALVLPPTPASCRDARVAVRTFCQEQGFPGLADDAELLTSELVTNAIGYASSHVSVTATVADATVLIHVTDDGGAPPYIAATLSTATCESGRGVYVVSEIAGDWGVIPSDNATTAWFRLP